jgi:GNAT superfamily N-acetyltransferase
MYNHENTLALFRFIGALSGHPYTQGAHFDWIKTPNSIWPNALLNMRCSPKKFEEVYMGILTQVQQGILPNQLLHNPGDPVNLLPLLKARASRYSVWCAMSHNLDSPEPTTANALLNISKINTTHALLPWLTLVETELMQQAGLHLSLFERLVQAEPCTLLVGQIEEQAVGTALLFTHKKSAGLYLITTAKKHRGKGIGKAMTLACLQEAKKLGCTNAYLQATTLGIPVYASVGFKENGNVHAFTLY